MDDDIQTSIKSVIRSTASILEPTLSEDKMTDTEMIEEERSGEDDGIEEEGELDEPINEELNFIDQQIVKHLTRYVKKRSADLEMLRIRFHGDPYIPPTLTDEQLILYLYTMQYNVARTVSLLRSNYKLRTILPSLFTARSVNSVGLQEVWNVLRIAVFPKKTNSHEQVIYIGLRDHKPENFKAHPAVKLFLMCADVYHILEGLPCSVIVILDGEGASHGYFNKDNYDHLKIVVKYVQESMPYNVDAVHVINTSVTIRTVFKMMKPFLTKDIINAVHFHADNNLKDSIPLRCLPAELGGTAPGSLDEYQANFRRKFEMMQEYFDMEEEQRTMYYFPEDRS